MQCSRNTFAGVHASGKDQVTPSLQKGHWLVLRLTSIAEEAIAPEVCASPVLVNIVDMADD
jgi:hypothetical protein